MKKTNPFLMLVLLLAITVASSVQAQDKYIDKNGTIVFEASEQAFEPVKAKNESVTVILNLATGDIASLALVKSFRFKNSLMEEHFNENYIESETYPKATFKGKLVDFDVSSLTEEETKFTVEGKMNLHGKEKQINTTLSISKSGESILVNGAFTVTPEDFDIEIPSIVKDKIAKNIEVSLNFNLIQK